MRLPNLHKKLVEGDKITSFLAEVQSDLSKLDQSISDYPRKFGLFRNHVNQAREVLTKIIRLLARQIYERNINTRIIRNDVVIGEELQPTGSPPTLAGYVVLPHRSTEQDPEIEIEVQNFVAGGVDLSESHTVIQDDGILCYLNIEDDSEAVRDEDGFIQLPDPEIVYHLQFPRQVSYCAFNLPNVIAIDSSVPLIVSHLGDQFVVQSTTPFDELTITVKPTPKRRDLEL